MSITTYITYGASILLGAILVLLALSAHVPLAGFIARSALSFLCLTVCAIYGALASLFLGIFGYRGLGQWTTARAFKWTMWATTGVTFVVQDEENLSPRPAVLIGNHQTELDVLMLGCVFPKYCSVSAKRSLKYWPFLGQFMALSKTVFIDRSNRQNARAAFEDAARVMKEEKQSVYIFPEGTRSYTSQPDMLPFKKGAFHLAVQAQVPIVPIVVANYSNVLHVQSKRFTGGKIPVKVLPPIPTKGLTSADVDDLTSQTREAMAKELITLTEIARGQQIAVSAERAKVLDDRNAIKTTGRVEQQPAVSRKV